jgi:GntR family transcriptional regulator
MFKVNPAAGQPLHQQLSQQIRHAIDTGVLQHGDLLPSIRTLAETLVVSPNTVVKAYSQLQDDGVIELRQGSGAYVTTRGTTKSKAELVRQGQARIRSLVERLQDEGLSDQEIRRLFEAQLLYPDLEEKKR